MLHHICNKRYSFATDSFDISKFSDSIPHVPQPFVQSDLIFRVAATLGRTKVATEKKVYKRNMDVRIFSVSFLIEVQWQIDENNCYFTNDVSVCLCLRASNGSEPALQTRSLYDTIDRPN